MLKGEVIVPRDSVGAIIGRGGEVIKDIGRNTGCQIQFKRDEDPSSPDRIAVVFARNGIDLTRATQMISNIVHSRDFAQPDHHDALKNVEESWVQVPADKAGIVIGKRGESIKQINAESGAFCKLTEDPRYHDTLRIFRISGNQQQIEHAKRLIQQKLDDNDLHGRPQRYGDYYLNNRMMQLNAYSEQQQWTYYDPQQAMYAQQYPAQTSVAMHSNGLAASCSGVVHSMYMPQPPQVVAMPVHQTQSTDQPDYSAAWVEYYRNLGFLEQAKLVEAAMQARARNN